METVIRVQNSNEVVWILHTTDTLCKGIYPIILPTATGKYLGRLNSLILTWQPVNRENFEFKPAKHRLKIDLVSHPARAEMFVNIYIYMCVCVCVCATSSILSYFKLTSV